MGTRLKFLGTSVFFTMVAFISFSVIASGVSHRLRFWVMALSCTVFAILSLVGVFFPQKMKWLMDAYKKKNEV